MKLLKLSLLVVAIIAVTLGSTFYYLSATGVLGASEAQAQNTLETPPPIKPIFLPLEPFTVTLRDNDSLNRILYVEITL